eukprot:8550-Eustigmatos_ZCMA.PRE.1
MAVRRNRFVRTVRSTHGAAADGMERPTTTQTAQRDDIRGRACHAATANPCLPIHRGDMLSPKVLLAT